MLTIRFITITGSYVMWFFVINVVPMQLSVVGTIYRSSFLVLLLNFTSSFDLEPRRMTRNYYIINSSTIVISLNGLSATCEKIFGPICEDQKTFIK